MTTPSKGILLSGGSRGLGLHLVQSFLARGHHVATFARKRTPAMDALAAQHGDRFLFAEADARDVAAVKPLLDRLCDRAGGLHGLVNNAAIGQDHLLANMAPAGIHDIIAVNIEATILLTRLAVRRMMLQPEGGRIVNISSICGMRGYQGLTVYSATKGAIDAFTRSLARELGDRRVLVNSVAPGFFESEMSSVLSASQLEVIRRRTATGKLTSEDDVTAALDLLLFGDSNITGQVIVVDGGATL